MTRLRIGDLLLLYERIEPWALEKAVVDHKRGGRRLVSFLISRAQLDADDGALALSEQLGVPAALQRHLEHRDPSVLPLIPADVARRWVAFPIARGRDGSLVVAARDPSPALATILAEVTKMRIVLAVTPAMQVERAVLAAYGEIEVDSADLVDFGADTPPTSATHAEFSEFELGHTPPPAKRRARTVSDFVDAVSELQLESNRAPTERTIELALHDIDSAVTRTAAEGHLLAYLGKFWKSALVLRVDGDFAVATREHNVEHRPLDAIRLALIPPSTLQVAYDTRAATSQRPRSPVQDRLATLLGTVSGAAPIVVTGLVEALVVVGTPLDPGRNVTAELDQLADAMGAVYTRHRGS